ncbi:MAG: hypothetical protein LQ349_007094 [Xanthoria aureola]|nr:MAG: hypothetical protein LQ349_007094 [Xanthoria aureola]
MGKKIEIEDATVMVKLKRFETNENQCKDPNFEILRRSQKAPEGEGLHDGTVTMLVNSSDDKITFVFVQKSPGVVRFLGEINQKQISQKRRSAGNLQ